MGSARVGVGVGVGGSLSGKTVISGAGGINHWSLPRGRKAFSTTSPTVPNLCLWM
jgi:hypothetical protein